VTGLTSNPTIFDHAIENSQFYDDAIRQKTRDGTAGEALFFEFALEDLSQAAALFRPVHDTTQGLDGWVSLEVSPLIANDTASTVAQAAELHARARLSNLLIEIPGTPEGIAAIEESIAAGVAVNVTLPFSREQYLAAAHAYMRGIERRLAAGLDPKVGSVASMFISRWDKAVMGMCRPSFAIDSGSLSHSAPTPPTGGSSTRRNGRRSRTPGRCRSGSSGPAPARKTLRPLMCSTSNPSPRQTRSTPSPRTHYAPSPIMATSPGRCRLTAATRSPCSVDSQRLEWTSRRWPAGCSARAPGRLTTRGTS
jgi:hypothetical protein